MVKLLFAVVTASASAILIGCQSHQGPPVAGQPIMLSNAAQPLTMRELLNNPKLQEVPMPVRVSFARDYPDDPAITDIQTISSAIGELIYNIHFIRHGVADHARYTVTGERLVEVGGLTQ